MPSQKKQIRTLLLHLTLAGAAVYATAFLLQIFDNLVGLVMSYTNWGYGLSGPLSMVYALILTGVAVAGYCWVVKRVLPRMERRALRNAAILLSGYLLLCMLLTAGFSQLRILLISILAESELSTNMSVVVLGLGHLESVLSGIITLPVRVFSQFRSILLAPLAMIFATRRSFTVIVAVLGIAQCALPFTLLLFHREGDGPNTGDTPEEQETTT